VLVLNLSISFLTLAFVVKSRIRTVDRLLSFTATLSLLCVAVIVNFSLLFHLGFFSAALCMTALSFLVYREVIQTTKSQVSSVVLLTIASLIWWPAIIIQLSVGLLSLVQLSSDKLRVREISASIRQFVFAMMISLLSIGPFIGLSNGSTQSIIRIATGSGSVGEATRIPMLFVTALLCLGLYLVARRCKNIMVIGLIISTSVFTTMFSLAHSYLGYGLSKMTLVVGPAALLGTFLLVVNTKSSSVIEYRRLGLNLKPLPVLSVLSVVLLATALVYSNYFYTLNDDAELPVWADVLFNSNTSGTNVCLLSGVSEGEIDLQGSYSCSRFWSSSTGDWTPTTADWAQGIWANDDSVILRSNVEALVNQPDFQVWTNSQSSLADRADLLSYRQVALAKGRSLYISNK